MPTITKIKRRPKGVFMMYDQIRDSGEGGNPHAIEHVKLDCDEEPTPEFDKALQALRPLAGKISEIDNGWLSSAVVKGITISEKKGGGKGVVITLQREVEKSNSPVNLASPFCSLESLTEAQQKTVFAMEDHALKYLGGDRQQGSLPLEENNGDGDGDGDGEK